MLQRSISATGGLLILLQVRMLRGYSVAEKDVGSLPEATGFSILLALAPVTEKDVGSLPEATGFSILLDSD
jgi:hypothetical protein